MGSSVDVVIPIYKAGNDFASMLEKLYKQSKRPEHIYLLQTIEKKDEKLFDIKKCSKELPGGQCPVLAQRVPSGRHPCRCGGIHAISGLW